VAAHSIVIVGAGFSGTALAINLLRLANEQPLRVVLVDPAHMARGVAYAKRPYGYLLNVPAGRMSASSLEPGEFLAFARRTLPQASAEDFLPRELYGDYLESSLATAARMSSARLDRVPGSVVAIEQAHRARRFELLLEDGRRLSADTVVLACGNPPPAPLRGALALQGSARYADDPWQAPAAFRAGERVLIVGTGLTAVDIALAGDHAVRGKAVIHAISRHGLVPPRQTAFRQQHVGYDSEALTPDAPPTVRQLFREVRRLAEDAVVRDGDWREVITLARSLAPALWQRLPVSERRRFLRHARTYWDIHRHRLPESTWAAVNEMRRTGRLQVHAGTLAALEPRGRRIHVSWRARGEQAERTLLVDRVVNCTGPDYDVRRSRDRLLRSLVAQGMALPDPLGLGVVTDEHGALRNTRGRSSSPIYYVGPMLRATAWETTAVQELRVYAERLACHLVAELDAGTVTRTSPPAGISRLSPSAVSGRTLGEGSAAAERSSASWLRVG
jgi:uncharacterized NAD(P)/FAD-binding protein YdhS